jgi:hypothetical protein
MGESFNEELIEGPSVLFRFLARLPLFPVATAASFVSDRNRLRHESGESKRTGKKNFAGGAEIASLS